MRLPTQRFWDAMIIREWYRFGNCKDLQRISKAEFGLFPNELALHRTEDCYGGVRAWVATYMPSLSFELLRTPKDKAIDVLDWLGKTKVRCVATRGATRYAREGYNKAKRSELFAEQVKISYNLGKLLNTMNQPNIVKSTSSRKNSRASR